MPSTHPQDPDLTFFSSKFGTIATFGDLSNAVRGCETREDASALRLSVENAGCSKDAISYLLDNRMDCDALDPEIVAVLKGEAFVASEAAVGLTREQHTAIDKAVHDMSLHPPSDPQIIQAFEAIREQFIETAKLTVMLTVPGSERSQAITAIQDAMQYAIASIARNQAAVLVQYEQTGLAPQDLR